MQNDYNTCNNMHKMTNEIRKAFPIQIITHVSMCLISYEKKKYDKQIRISIDLDSTKIKKAINDYIYSIKNC